MFPPNEKNRLGAWRLRLTSICTVCINGVIFRELKLFRLQHQELQKQNAAKIQVPRILTIIRSIPESLHVSTP